MSYARWATKEEVAERASKINLKELPKKSGLPIMYDDNYLYIDEFESHNLLIGSTGSGKTQSTILPMIKLSTMVKESFLLNDPMGEVNKLMSKKLKEEGYEVITLNFQDAKLGNSWNPLALPYYLYKNNNMDKAMELLDDLGYYLFFNPQESNSDPFWTNSTINYLIGLTLYLFENAQEEEIHLNSVYQLSNAINEEQNREHFLSQLKETSNIYIYLSGTLKAPTETRGSILSVFNQKMRLYIARENLSNMLSYSDFDIKEISNHPTALFLVGGTTTYCQNLAPLFVNQVIDSIEEFGKKEKGVNILLDEFDEMVPIRNFAKIASYCRSIKIKITVTIRSYMHLYNMYSKEEAEILKMCFGNILYLLSNDIYTLEEISKLCGNQIVDNTLTPLVTVEELKTLKHFEAILLMPRLMPFKTKLLPDYQIDWGYTCEEEDIPVRNVKEVKIFNLKEN